MRNDSKLIAIVGPTGSGKTEWAKKIARRFNGKIISADSRQIYKGFDIGTNKDKSYPQDLIDVAEPFENFTLADYQKLANELINTYLRVKTLPVLAGGTGLYINAVLYGFIIPEVKEQNKKLRQNLEKLDVVALFHQLQKLDPETAKKIDPRNKRRLVRALEYVMLANKSFIKAQKRKRPSFQPLIIGIKTERDTLYSRVDARVEQMVKSGLVQEVRNLSQKYRKDLPVFNTIGYREILEYISGKLSLKEAIERIKLNTHDYIRRQETWFRRNPDIKWVSCYSEAEKLVEKFLKK